MTTATSTVPIPEELFQDISQHAIRDGISIEQWIFKVLAERFRLERETEEFFKARALRASDKKLGELLNKAPNRPPDPGDELEP